MNNYSIYIIALPDELNQAKLLEDKIRDMGCYEEIQHISAVDGRNLKAKDYFSYITNVFNKKGQLLSPGEIGCTLSHLAILNEIIRNNKPALVLEYDAILDENFNDLMMVFSQLKRASVIQMCSQKRFVNFYLNAKKLNFNDKLNLHCIEPSYGMWGTTAYAINVEAAQEVIKSHSRGPFVADDWVELINTNHCDFYYRRFFDHSEEPNNHMEQERIISDKDAVASVLKNYEKEVIKRISAKKVILDRILSIIK